MPGQKKDIDTLTEDELARYAEEAMNDADNLHGPGGDDTPADPENLPEGGPDEGQLPDDEPVEPEAPEGQEPSDTKGGDDPAESGILKTLRDKGWEHDFKTEAEALEGLVELRRFAGRKLEHEALGRLAAESGMTPDQLKAVMDDRGTEDVDPLSWKPPVEFDSRWEREIKVEEDGTLSGPSEMVANFQKYVGYRDDYWQRLGNDPAGLVRSNRGMIEEIVNDTLARQRAAEMSQNFLKTNGNFIREHRTEFEGLLERGMPPDLALDHMKLIHGDPEKPDPDKPKGKDAKAADKAKLRKRSANPKRVKTPVRDQREVDYSTMSEEDLARLALKEKGIVLSFDD